MGGCDIGGISNGPSKTGKVKGNGANPTQVGAPKSNTRKKKTEGKKKDLKIATKTDGQGSVNIVGAHSAIQSIGTCSDTVDKNKNRDQKGARTISNFFQRQVTPSPPKRARAIGTENGNDSNSTSLPCLGSGTPCTPSDAAMQGIDRRRYFELW